MPGWPPCGRGRYGCASRTRAGARSIRTDNASTPARSGLRTAWGMDGPRAGDNRAPFEADRGSFPVRPECDRRQRQGRRRDHRSHPVALRRGRDQLGTPVQQPAGAARRERGQNGQSQ